MMPIKITDIVQGPVWEREMPAVEWTCDALQPQIKACRQKLYNWWKGFFNKDFNSEPFRSDLTVQRLLVTTSYFHPTGWIVLISSDHKTGIHRIVVYWPRDKHDTN